VLLPANTAAKPVIWQVMAVAEAAKSSSYGKVTTITVAASPATALPPPTS
jgi:hypothetical protein